MKSEFVMKKYNEGWFKDCHHMALLHATSNLISEYDCLICNQVYYYVKDEQYGIQIERIDFFNVYDILPKFGIECEVQNESSLRDILERGVNKNTYIIAGIDNYYESIRRDFFLKKHVAHSMLISEVNYKKSEVTILEQPLFFSHDYQFYKISIEELIKSNLSFNERKNDPHFFLKKLPDICKYKGNLPEISILKKREEKRVKNIETKLCFMSKLLSYRKKVYCGIEYLNEFIEEIEAIIEKSIIDIEFGEKLIENLSAIIQGKTEELVAIKRVISMDVYPLYENNQKKIITNWSMIRNYISKMIYSKKIKDYKIQDLLANILSCEYKNFEVFYDRCDSK